MTDYRKRAEAVTVALKAVGYDTEHLETVDVVKVIIEGKNWYITPASKNMPNSLPLTSTITVLNVNIWRQINLYYANNVEYTLYANKSAAHIRGKCYNNYHSHEDNILIGYLHNNTYMGIYGKWVSGNAYYPTYIVKKGYELKDIEKGDILDLDFMPSAPQIVDIKNDNHKLIKVLNIKASHISTITAFGKFIANGKYTDSGRDDLFKYVNEDGELFALLYDQTTGEMTLSSSAVAIKLTNVKTCLVERVDGLYDGYEIHDSSAALLKYRDETGNIVDFKCDPSDGPLPMVFRFNDIFFALGYGHPKTVVLDMRKPNGGAKTKVAAPASIAEYNE